MNDTLNKPSLQDRIRLVRVQRFFDNSGGNPVFVLAAGILFALLTHNEGGSDSRLLAWLLALAVACFLILAFEWRVKREGVSYENAERFFRIRTWLGGLVAVLLGMSVFLLPENATRAAHAFLFLVSSSIVAGAYMAYVPAYVYCLMLTAFCLTPYVLNCIYLYLVGGDTFFVFMALASIIWQVYFATRALRVSRSIIAGIELRERLRDETIERRASEMALMASQELAQQLATKLRLMCDNVPDMIWAKDVEGRYTFVNKAYCETVLGLASADLALGMTYDEFVRREQAQHPDNPEWHTCGQHTGDIDQHTLARSEPTVYEESGTIRGRFMYLDVHQARLTDIHGDVVGIVGCARDITERKASEDFVNHLAHHDVLTDLPNRLLLTDRLRQAIALARRDKGKLAVMFLDLDRLKPVNDTLGHDVGDLLLKEVAKRMCEVVTRRADTVARLGGDEFVILLQRVNMEQDAAVVAEKIVHALAQPFTICRNDISISASIGIAIYPQHGDDSVQLLRNADLAMYSAKSTGRNGYRFFDESMHSGNA